jgi:hypothetical protein
MKIVNGKSSDSICSSDIVCLQNIKYMKYSKDLWISVFLSDFLTDNLAITSFFSGFYKGDV